MTDGFDFGLILYEAQVAAAASSKINYMRNIAPIN